MNTAERRNAIHEAGHAIAAHALGRHVKSVSIIPLPFTAYVSGHLVPVTLSLFDLKLFMFRKLVSVLIWCNRQAFLYPSSLNFL